MPSETLFLERQFSTSPERLFEIFTTPELLARWHCGTVLESIMDLKPAGEFLIRFAPDQNVAQELCVRGVYREVQIHERLVYTWKWDGTEEESLVTVMFEPSGRGTRLRIRHERLGSEESVAGHRFGWEACLEGLARMEGTIERSPAE